jgi:hypothetical protein
MSKSILLDTKEMSEEESLKALEARLRKLQGLAPEPVREKTKKKSSDVLVEKKMSEAEQVAMLLQGVGEELEIEKSHKIGVDLDVELDSEEEEDRIVKIALELAELDQQN